MATTTFANPFTRVDGVSPANTAITVTTPTNLVAQVVEVRAAYSAAPTHTGVTVTKRRSGDASFDTLLLAGDANAQYTVWLPQGQLWLMDGEVLEVAAPAGGAGITCGVEILLRRVP